MGLSEPLSVTDSLLSIDTYVPLGAIDTGTAKSLVYTLAVVTNNLKWTVYGANAADYSDEAVVQSEATVNAGALGTYTTVQAVYRYYRAKLKAAVGGSQGTGTIRGVAKN
ncbi:MAG: hypothetical protein ACREN0_11805 [Thermodesulfobacteriota bacterium]